MDETFEGFTRDPSWGDGRPSPGYLDDTIADLRRLDPFLQREVVLIDQGEGSWPQPLLAAAINGLADLGRPIRHLEFQATDHGPTQQVENAMESDVEVTRLRMLNGVHKVPADRRGILVWDVGHN